MPESTNRALKTKEFVFCDLQQHFVSMVISDDEIRQYLGNGSCRLTEPRIVSDYARHMALQLLHLYYSYEVERLDIRYPKDWWEAFKDRWFTKRMLKRWPPKYTHRVIKKEIALTDLPIDSYKYKVFIRDISHLVSTTDTY